MYRIVLVDDHQLLRDGIRTILEHEPEFEVVGEAGSGAEAVQLCKQLNPDVVVLDIGLPGMNGIDAAAEITRHCSGSRIVMLSMFDDESTVIGAVRSGAHAFVLKKAAATDLLDALRTVARGGSYFGSHVSDRLLQGFQRPNPDAKDRHPMLRGLSPREIQVLRMVAEGKTSKDVAALLELGEHTVRSYRKTLMKKLGVNNVAGLTQVALSSGLIPPSMKSNADVLG